MSASYYLTALFDNCISQRQLVSYSVTRPFLSAKGVVCETNSCTCTHMHGQLTWLHCQAGWFKNSASIRLQCWHPTPVQSGRITKATSFTGQEGSGSPTSIELLPCWGDQSDSCSSWTLASHNQLKKLHYSVSGWNPTFAIFAESRDSNYGIASS